MKGILAPCINYIRRKSFIMRWYRRLRYSSHNKHKFSSYHALEKRIANQMNALSLVSEGPLISIIVPVYDPKVDEFIAMIESITSQSYTNWQLILVDDCSTKPDIKEYLAKLRQQPKIIVKTRETNGHISAASNDGLALASGTFSILVDQDDILKQDALKVLVIHINANSDGVLFYSDEDKVLPEGNINFPHFKPQWSPDLLLSHNYIGHLIALNTQLLKSIGGFRLGVEGAQDYDLLLRVSQACSSEHINHIPYMLYSWRMSTGSTASNPSAKSYTHEAGKRALTDHLSAIGSGARVDDGLLANTYRVRWPLPTKRPRVSIIIPTRDNVSLLRNCIASVLAVEYSNMEVVIVDNQSRCQHTLKYLDELPMMESAHDIKVLQYSHPFNFSAINNYGVSQVDCDIILFMNNDIEAIGDQWLHELVSHAVREQVGCVGAKLYFPDGRIQHGGVITGIGGVAGHAHKHFDKNDAGYARRLKVTQNVSAVTGACLAVKKSLFDAVGGFDEDNLGVAFNDVDLCLRISELGVRNVWTPFAEMIHHESASRGQEDSQSKKQRFQSESQFMMEQWGARLSCDPFYSPWLSLEREDFSYQDNTVKK